MYKTIGILAHVDAGKTTLSEQILYQCNAIRKLGRVDHKDSLLDSNAIEKRRGITIFSDAASFQIEKDTYYLIDTPGHMDFQAECERVLPILDYAILIISGVEMVQAHTENLFHLLREYHVPVFLFINKIDRENADLEGTLGDIRKNLDDRIVYLRDKMEVEESKEQCGFPIIKSMPEELLEKVAEYDEDLLEQYFTGTIDYNQFYSRLITLIKENEIIIASAGSALNNQNIDVFLHNFHYLTKTYYEDRKEEPFRGKTFRVTHEANHTRISYIKCLSGSLKVKEEISYSIDGIEYKEKTNQLRFIQGPKYQMVDQVEAGMVFAATGIQNTKSGQGLGVEKQVLSYVIQPVLKAKVIYDGQRPITDILKILKELEDEEPILKVEYQESLKQIQIAVAGMIQLEMIAELVKNRYDITIEFGQCDVVYKETIEQEIIGYGHYEPLRHYAEVHLRIQQGEKDSGIKFASECSTDILAKNWQNLIETHVFERKHKGVLGGFELTDVKITLVTGRAHLKHTEGGDFREAVYRAIRQGLRSTKTILLEPYYSFKMEADASLMAKLLSDIQQMYGTCENPIIEEGMCRIGGRGPVSTFLCYYERFLSLTKGRGRMNVKFDGYEPCHNEAEVLKVVEYQADRDFENTANSIFCSHGAGYEVNWQEAKEKMHCVG